MRNSLYLGVFGCCANKCLGVQNSPRIFIYIALFTFSINRKEAMREFRDPYLKGKESRRYLSFD